jgi:manganese/zinc/iron transport system permease protein
MSPAQVEIQLIAAVTAAACALPGVFLVLRRMAMLSDAISHSILLGIVLAFFVTRDLASPLLLVAAAVTGLVTVALVELLGRTRLLKKDAAIGLVFPVLFSAGVILIARYAGDVHLDVDSVLLGELAFAPFNRFELFGIDLGPVSLMVMIGALLANTAFLLLFYKEMKLSTFDPELAAALGFSPVLLHYTHMGLVSVTAVSAFDAVGSVLVVALMIGPPAAAYLLTDRLPVMIALSVGIGVTSALSGYWLAHSLDASIAGSMAAMTGVAFLLALFFAPGRGLAAIAGRRRRQRLEFAGQMLAVHLLQHEGCPDEPYESSMAQLEEHFRWDRSFAQQIVRLGLKRELMVQQDDCLQLTESGRELARVVVVR